jgi:hypothetical protein
MVQNKEDKFIRIRLKIIKQLFRLDVLRLRVKYIRLRLELIKVSSGI